eukprot:1189529-Prorocentrum_minimum.AAC.2
MDAWRGGFLSFSRKPTPPTQRVGTHSGRATVVATGTKVAQKFGARSQRRYPLAEQFQFRFNQKSRTTVRVETPNLIQRALNTCALLDLADAGGGDAGTRGVPLCRRPSAVGRDARERGRVHQIGEGPA